MNIMKILLDDTRGLTKRLRGSELTHSNKL